jgi:uncharacterized protein (DUF362 family)
MKLHPFLCDPRAVLIVQYPLPRPPLWDDFHQAARLAMHLMQVELENEAVVIKPNVTSGERIAVPDSGITTHPAFVEGIARYSLEHGTRARRVTIAEDPRDSDDNAPRHWMGTGYEQLGVRLHTPTTYTCVKKPVQDPQVFPRLNVSRIATAPRTVLINVPKLKTHNLAITTLGMKNLMGLVNVFDRHYCLQAWEELPEEVRNNPRPRREWFTETMHMQWQMGLARRLIDTAQVIQPALTIVEGIVGREGTGFQRGQNRALGMVVAGINVVAVDSLASYLMGFDPETLPYLALAAQRGLGENRVAALRVYVGHEGEIVPCADPSALRCSPPFQVIRNIREEDRSTFRSSPGVIDPSDSFFGKSKA